MPTSRICRSNYTAALLLVATAATTSALPYPRSTSANSSPNSTVTTAFSYMKEALQTFLASQQGVDSFHAISGGWQPIDFAGNDASELSANDAYYMADQLFVPSPVSYSQMMIDFIQQVNIDMNLNSITSKVNSPAVLKAQNATSLACTTGMNTALTQAAKQYATQQGVSANNKTDPAFLQFAAQDTAYQQASDECQSATNAYEAQLSNAVGKDFYIFSGALNAITQIMNPTTEIPGLTMQVSDETNVAGKTDGHYKPYYSFPTLNGTVSAWQSPDNSDFAPNFHWNSNSSSNSTSSTSSSGGASVGFIWEDFSGSGSGSSTNTKTSANTSATGMDITFGQIAMFGVDYGLWNNPDVASALQSPSDSVSQKGAQAFQQYYGTAEKPGPLAAWKNQALVVYQPGFAIQFETSAQAADFHQSAGSAGACFLFICIGGSGSSSTNNTQYEEGSTVVTYNDTSNQAYLVGFSETTYYPNQGVQAASNWNFTSLDSDSDSPSSSGNETDSSSSSGADTDSSSSSGDDSDSSGADTDSPSSTGNGTDSSSSSGTDADSSSSSGADTDSPSNGDDTDSSSPSSTDADSSSSSDTDTDSSSPDTDSSTSSGTGATSSDDPNTNASSDDGTTPSSTLTPVSGTGSSATASPSKTAPKNSTTSLKDAEPSATGGPSSSISPGKTVPTSTKASSPAKVDATNVARAARMVRVSSRRN